MPRTSGHYYPPLEPQPLLHTLLRATAIVTIFAVVLGAIYLSGGADPLVHWLEEKFFKAEAKAEAQVLEKAGSEKVEGLMKERLKNNPVVSNDELNEISSGLGDEASKEFEGLMK